MRRTKSGSSGKRKLSEWTCVPGAIQFGGELALPFVIASREAAKQSQCGGMRLLRALRALAMTGNLPQN